MIAFTVIRSAPGAPELSNAFNRMGLTCLSIVYIGQWGIFLISGTPANMISLDAEPTAFILAVIKSKNGYIINPDLNNPIPEPRRIKINQWLTARGYDNIPAGWTYKQVIIAILRRSLSNPSLDRCYLTDDTEG